MTTSDGWVSRFRRWLHDGAQVSTSRHDEPVPGAAHAPGHRHLAPPPKMPEPRQAEIRAGHDQPWVPTGGLIDRLRRSERRG